MKNADDTTRLPAEGEKRRPRRHRLLRALAIILGAFILIVGIAIYSVPYLLNTSIAREYLLKYANSALDADIGIGNIDVDIWSHFPRVSVSIDSVTVVSHALDSLPAAERRDLPSDASFLGSIDNISGEVNLLKAIKNRWVFKTLYASGIRVNLVTVNDSIGNYNIFTPISNSDITIPYFQADSIRLTDIRSIRYTDMQIAATADMSVHDLQIVRTEGNNYGLAMGGNLDTQVAGFPIFQSTPFSITGKILLDFRPFRIALDDLRLRLDSYNSMLAFSAEVGETVRISDFNCNVSSLELISVWRFFADKYFPQYASIANHIVLDTNVRLQEPYDLSSEKYPVINLFIDKLRIEGGDVDVNLDAEVFDVLNAPSYKCGIAGDVNLGSLQRYLPELKGYDLRGTAATNITMSGELASLAKGDFDIDGTLQTRHVSLRHIPDSVSLDIDTLRLAVSSRLKSTPSAVRNRLLPADLRPLDGRHTPVFLNLAASKGFSKFVNGRDTHVALHAGRGKFSHPGYREPQYFSNLNLSLSEDSLNINSLDVRSSRNRLSLQAHAAGIREWLAGGVGAPLNLQLALNIDSLDFNQIAYTLRHGNTPQPADTVQSHEPAKTLLVPRNLNLNATVTAKEFSYTNLRLSHLRAGIAARKGVVEITPLDMQASFASGNMAFRYDTSDIDSISFDADMELKNLDVVKFFDKYQNLLAMMPQMKNLSGEVGGKLQAHVLVFPNMHLNIGSLTARIDAYGENLEVKQNNFIRHITKMMLIPFDTPLHISNIAAHANVHDNMLELYPFDVEFFKYKVRMMGINDFQGNLNYVVDVLHMPLLPVHFGIDIKGTYDHPELRLSDGHYDIRRTQHDISIIQYHDIYVIGELQRLMNMFINHASESYEPQH